MRRLPLAAATLCVASAAAADPLPILGGTAAGVDDFPSVVAITIGDSLCTGTLIHRDWVVTAAHCLAPEEVQLPSQEAVTQSVRVYFGTVDIMRPGGEVRTASQTIPHPGFSAASLGKDDIGLIQLTQPMTTIPPSPVNVDPARAPVGTTVTMVGFGVTASDGAGMLGAEFVLAGRTSTTCTAYGMADETLLCFSQADGLGKCRGDSGGPSFAALDGRQTLVGVTSFGDPSCAEIGADTRTDAEPPFLLTYVPRLDGCDGEFCSQASGGCAAAGGGGPAALLGIAAGAAALGRRRGRPAARRRS
jgi:secreted trypsin-like serine protease